jgi:hypothetical protein
MVETVQYMILDAFVDPANFALANPAGIKGPAAIDDSEASSEENSNATDIL